MSEQGIRDLFYSIALLAVNSGIEFSLEYADTHTEDKVLNGSMKNYHSEVNGLTLRVYPPIQEFKLEELLEDNTTEGAADD